jgi:hypothetical protein
VRLGLLEKNQLKQKRRNDAYLCVGRSTQPSGGRKGIRVPPPLCDRGRLVLSPNEFGVYLRFLANPQFAMKNGFFGFKAEGRKLC